MLVPSPVKLSVPSQFTCSRLSVCTDVLSEAPGEERGLKAPLSEVGRGYRSRQGLPGARGGTGAQNWGEAGTWRGPDWNRGQSRETKGRGALHAERERPVGMLTARPARLHCPRAWDAVGRVLLHGAPRGREDGSGDPSWSLFHHRELRVAYSSLATQEG